MDEFFPTLILTIHHYFAALMTRLNNCFAILILFLNHCLTIVNHCFTTLTTALTQYFATTLGKMTVVASIGVGIQYGWTVQDSLFATYIQRLGVSHKWNAYIWLCGPISSTVVEPLVGYYTDRCRSQFGRRRPFIFCGFIGVVFASLLIGFATDLGDAIGDDMYKKPQVRAVVLFVLGFWIFHVANNMLQASCRAFVVDLAAHNRSQMRIGNHMFSFFMFIGRILGYFVCSYEGLYTMFPFVVTKACEFPCANLKICLIILILILVVLCTITLVYIEDVPLSNPQPEPQISHFDELQATFNGIPRPMWMLMLVTAINWVAWYSFFHDLKDWMGGEVYGGKKGDQVYLEGVRSATLGMMMTAVVSALMSLVAEPLGRYVGGANRLWGVANILLTVCLTMAVVITKVAKHDRHVPKPNAVMPSTGVKVSALLYFIVLGVPLAINYSVPFALASIYCSRTGAGQGLYLGLLNSSDATPLIILSALSGHWNSLFGGSNLPTIVIGAIAAVVSAVLAFVVLPTPLPTPTA